MFEYMTPQSYMIKQINYVKIFFMILQDSAKGLNIDVTLKQSSMKMNGTNKNKTIL